MGAQERCRICRLLEKMDRQEQFCNRVGLINTSTFHNRPAKEQPGDAESYIAISDVIRTSK